MTDTDCSTHRSATRRFSGPAKRLLRPIPCGRAPSLDGDDHVLALLEVDALANEFDAEPVPATEQRQPGDGVAVGQHGHVVPRDRPAASDADAPACDTDRGLAAVAAAVAAQQSPAVVVWQAAVDDARTSEVEFVPDSPYVNDSEGYSYELIDPFRDHEYVAVDGTHYDIELAGTGTLYASYGIRATEATPDQNATVVAVDDLPDRVRDEVRSAVENGNYHAPMGKWDSLPQSLQDTRYVSHENQTYRLSYVVSDFWAFELRLDRVE